MKSQRKNKVLKSVVLPNNFKMIISCYDNMIICEYHERRFVIFSPHDKNIYTASFVECFELKTSGICNGDYVIYTPRGKIKYTIEFPFRNTVFSSFVDAVLTLVYSVIYMRDPDILDKFGYRGYRGPNSSMRKRGITATIKTKVNEILFPVEDREPISETIIEINSSYYMAIRSTETIMFTQKEKEIDSIEFIVNVSLMNDLSKDVLSEYYERWENI